MATTVNGSSGILDCSWRCTLTSGSDSIASVIRRAKSVRSTARALPAGTATASATRTTSEPICLNSAFSRPAAWSSALPRRLFEQTSSARSPVWWTGVGFAGRISKRSTPTPRRASCHAASQPASPPPTTVAPSIREAV